MSSKRIIKFISRPAFLALVVGFAGAFLGVFWYFTKCQKVVVFELHPSAEDSFVEYIGSNPKWLHDVNLQKINGYERLWKMRNSPLKFGDGRQIMDEAVKQVDKWASNLRGGDKVARQVVWFHEGAQNQPISTDCGWSDEVLRMLKGANIK